MTRKNLISEVAKNLDRLIKYDSSGRIKNYYLSNLGHPLINFFYLRHKSKNGLVSPLGDRERFEFELALLSTEALADMLCVLSGRVDLSDYEVDETRGF